MQTVQTATQTLLIERLWRSSKKRAYCAGSRTATAVNDERGKDCLRVGHSHGCEKIFGGGIVMRRLQVSRFKQLNRNNRGWSLEGVRGSELADRFACLLPWSSRLGSIPAPAAPRVTDERK